MTCEGGHGEVSAVRDHEDDSWSLGESSDSDSVQDFFPESHSFRGQAKGRGECGRASSHRE